MVLVQVQPSAIFICRPSATWSAFVGVATEGSIPKGGYCTAVAQLEEQRSPKPPVDSSILFCRAKYAVEKVHGYAKISLKTLYKNTQKVV